MCIKYEHHEGKREPRTNFMGTRSSENGHQRFSLFFSTDRRQQTVYSGLKIYTCHHLTQRKIAAVEGSLREVSTFLEPSPFLDLLMNYLVLGQFLRLSPGGPISK